MFDGILKGLVKMKAWLQRLLITSVAVLTLGIITPSHEVWQNFQDKEEPNEAGSKTADVQYSLQLEEQTAGGQLAAQAKRLSYEKFGSRIGPVIQNEFDTEIFPRIEAVIDMTVHNAENRLLAITEKPSGQYAEKIFHVHDQTAGKDLIRFHVRTEKRPQDGYFYNFHYHTEEDHFAAHHTLGEIHWSKNTPPKWLS